MLDISALYAWLMSEYGNNDFLVGTTVPAVLVGIGYLGRSILTSIKDYIWRTFTSEITINTDTSGYEHITAYLFKDCVVPFFQRRFLLRMKYGRHTKGPKANFEVGYGNSFGMIQGRPIIINRTVEESDSEVFKEIVKVTIIGSRKRIARMMANKMEHYVRTANASDDVEIHTDANGFWDCSIVKPKRDISSIILPEHQKLYLKEKIEKFLSSENDYIKKGIPYSMGILLHGPPGTGKSSLIHAIASQYNKNIYYSKSGKLDRVGEVVDEGGILVLEDIDASKIKHNREDGSPTDTTSFSDILNVLDGTLTPHGLITIATTNHITNLDPALVRHGRFDVQLKLGLTQWPEWLELEKLLERDTNVAEDDFVPLSGAEARYMLTYYSEDAIIDKFKEKRNT